MDEKLCTDDQNSHVHISKPALNIDISYAFRLS